MNKIKTYFLRFQAFSLALFVAIISSGFIYHWEVCTHAEQTIVCHEEEQTNTCCCSNSLDFSQCECSDLANNICDISFSKYVQFDFEALTSNNQNLISEVSLLSACSCFACIQHFISDYYLVKDNFYPPPPLNGRQLLCIIQTFLI
jgi:hypothetical protein